MPSNNPLSAEEMAEIRELLEESKIRKLRVRYAQLIDSRNYDGAAELWTEDAVSDFGPLGVWRGREEIRRQWREHYSEALPFSGLHCSTNLAIELTGPVSAISRSYLQSVFADADPRSLPTGLFGINDYEYAKRDGAWQISASTLHILWPQRIVGDDLLESWPPDRFR